MVESEDKLSEMRFSALLERLATGESPGREGWRLLLTALSGEQDCRLRRCASEVARRNFGNGIYIRGLIEISSCCRNDCYYCGLRRSNRQASRYRLTADEILDCCREGDRLGFGTFVLHVGDNDVGG